MFDLKTLVVTLFLFAGAASEVQDKKEVEAWKAYSAAVTQHKYPARGRFVRTPEQEPAALMKKLDQALGVAKDTSAEPIVLFNLGNALFNLGDFENARKTFEDLKTRFPNHGLVKSPAAADPAGPTMVDAAIADCVTEATIRKTYEVKRLPAAVIDEKAHAVFHTSQGDFTMRFYKSAAPETVANFKKLITTGFYNDTYFHRVATMQKIWGGCPNTKPASRGREDDGQGGVPYDLPYELSTAQHTAGAVSMVRIQGKDRSHGCHFSICVTEQPDLNGQQAPFGVVTEGLDVVKKISQQRADDIGNPYESVTIKGVEWFE